MNRYDSAEWIGKKYNMLTVIEPVHVVLNNGNKQWYWRTQCECGKVSILRPSSVINGRQKSCGCYRKTGKQVPCIHNESHTRLHNIWCSMNNRCNPAHKHSERYGKRGICICDEWHDYTKFAEWARANGYSDGLTIERVDVNGNYEPGNCKWIPLEAQARNRRTTRWVDYQGEKMSLAEAAQRAGLPYKQVHFRLKKGWTVEEALSVPISHGLSDLHKECIRRNVDYHMVYNRIVVRGWDKERAFMEPAHPRRKKQTAE